FFPQTQEFSPSIRATRNCFRGMRVAPNTSRRVIANYLESNQRKKEKRSMLWAIFIAGTYVAGIYLIRLVWWQE
ncbi:MAG TPA: hypothetical protein PKK30_16005, partial [Nitrospira sp.]|nr:hypothetical protein [Nitrospira sp.]